MPMPKNHARFHLVLLVAASVFPVYSQAQQATESAAAREFAADKEEPIDQIVVVANKSGRSIREIAANVTVVSRESISNNLATSVADVFRYTPGIDYEASGSRFGTEGINIRGIGGNRVAMLVDGVPLSDQFDVGVGLPHRLAELQRFCRCGF